MERRKLYFLNKSRQRRQLEPVSASGAQQIDLNITVPFVFSARLYPYGVKNGDAELVQEYNEFRPSTPIIFMGKSIDKIWICRNGLVSLSPTFIGAGMPTQIPINSGEPLIAVFWTEGEQGGSYKRRLFVRESIDENTLGLAQNEVNIQFRHSFTPQSVIIITWLEDGEGDNVLFQLALILDKNACFAHFVYSHVPEEEAIVGINGPQSTSSISSQLDNEEIKNEEETLTNTPINIADAEETAEEREEEEKRETTLIKQNNQQKHKRVEAIPILERHKRQQKERKEEKHLKQHSKHFVFPGSGTSGASLQVTQQSNIGIPGEWLIRIDQPERVFLCGAGFRGLECVDSCSPTQWYMDCSKTCHCADGKACNADSGECPESKCSPGWQGPPTCDEDVDECANPETTCPDEQPDCMNTPGSFLCFCVEYDNQTGLCISQSDSPISSNIASETTEASLSHQNFIFSTEEGKERIPVPIASLSLIPQLGPKTKNNLINKRRQQERQPLNNDGIVDNDGLSIKVQPVTIRPLFAGARLSHPFSPSNLSPHPSQHPSLLLPSNPSDIPLPPQSKFRHHPLSSTSIPKTTTTLIPSSNLIFANCHRQCIAEQGICLEGGECRCAPGWQGDGRVACMDVDECASKNEKICGPNAECQNLPGSYQCVCNPGFVANPNGQGCLDVDECAESAALNTLENVCPHPNTRCLNTIGGFHCECSPGFNGNPNSGDGCNDIDECLTAEYYCGKHAICVNLIGSFRCDCNTGFERQPNSNHCQDIDECADATNCHKGSAICTNLEGSFHCECIEGFVGDGRQCHESILFPTTKQTTSSLFNNNLSPLTIKEVRIEHGKTLNIFGKQYSTLFVSPKGIISIGAPLNESVVSNIFTDNGGGLPPLILPLVANYDTKSMGSSIDVIVVDEELDNVETLQRRKRGGLLSRASLLIRDGFRIAEFQATQLIIATFNKLVTTQKDLNEEMVNF
uniref:EGF-like domain-containing protein n=1 Tax=Meloidogyne hapla TaxID=6305 RepID=A0A1I8BSD7_MELHA